METYVEGNIVGYGQNVDTDEKDEIVEVRIMLSVENLYALAYRIGLAQGEIDLNLCDFHLRRYATDWANNLLKEFNQKKEEAEMMKTYNDWWEQDSDQSYPWEN